MRMITLRYKYDNDVLYSQICDQFNLTKELSAVGPYRTTWSNTDGSSPLRKVYCYNIHYNDGPSERLWRVEFTIDLQLLYGTSPRPVPFSMLEDLDGRLEAFYKKELTVDLKQYLPDMVGESYLERRISYVEYMIYIEDVNAEDIMKQLKRCRFDRKQLDVEYFEDYRIRSSTPAITINQLDNSTIRICVKCWSTALNSMHRRHSLPDMGIPISILFDREIVANMIFTQVKKFTKPKSIDMLNPETFSELL